MAGSIYSTVKFFLYTLFGSLLMLLAIIGLYLIHGGADRRLHLCPARTAADAAAPRHAGLWLFAAFLLAFAIKFPLFPLHTWLPDAHTDAPTAGSVILAGLLLKTGAYGLIRFGYPALPRGGRTASRRCSTAWPSSASSTARWVAFAQQDMKRLIAYSSIGHMGFVALGIAAWTAGGPFRLDPADGQPRHHHRRAVRHGRDARRADRYPGDRLHSAASGERCRASPSSSCSSAWPPPGCRGSTTSSVSS